ncbi:MULTISPECIES: UvrD-helicase domain-containing protein [unclassified Microcoleus]|uniref:UvrD-helicase domain-containing protein n=1 Tax=unclassified Microcoleus TaxID=2642155 RepID=UPI002FD19C4E
MELKLSQYQSGILQAIQQRCEVPAGKPIKGLLIEALAGTGKSFTLVEICSLLRDLGVKPEQARLVVFGRKNKEDLATKLGVRVGRLWKNSVSTLHSLSYQILREALNTDHKTFKLQNWKYEDIAANLGFIRRTEYVGKNRQYIPGNLFSNSPEDKIRELEREFLQLLELLRLYCFPPYLDSIAELVELHNLDIPVNYDVATAATQCLKVGLHDAITNFVIDCTDMSWVLWMHRDKCKGTLEKWRSQFRMIAVDECQDTDVLQLNILSLLVDPAKNFLVAVGDKHQAVYSFRGCVSDGVEKFTELFNCETLQLPVNYRCGRSHLELVRKIFPHIPIEPHPGAGEGEIKILKHDEFLSLFQDESKSYIGVCRKNAPLLIYAIKLLAAGKPAKIKDKSLGKRVLDEVSHVITKSKLPYEVETFPQALASYETRERDRLLKYKDSEARISLLTDMLAAVLALFEAYQPSDLGEWTLVVDKIFDESDGKRCINLYSIHSGKGGEGDVAFILEPELMPFSHKGQTPEEKEQENNLLYVALTRPKEVLALVLAEDKSPGDISWLPKEYIKNAGSEPLASILPPGQEDGKEVVTQEELLELLGKIQNLPRPKQRTIFRELVDRLGKESIFDLLQ